MGNNQSRNSAPHSPAQPVPHRAQSQSQSHAKDSLHHAPTNTQKKEPRRRESLQALQSGIVGGSGKAAPAAPTASLTSATGTAEYRPHSTSNSARVNPTSTVQTATVRPASIHSNKSAHQGAGTPHLKPTDSITEESAMGNEGSKLAPSPSPLKVSDEKDAPTATTPKGGPQAEATVGPMDVTPSEAAGGVNESPISPDQSYSLPTTSQFSRPPRLPLPIGEEDYTPGSPIISSADLTDPIEPIDGEAGVTRSRSMLSGTTMDDDDGEDDSQSGGVAGEAIGPAIPTMVEWRGSGEKVYVTGTFAVWDKKYRLHKDGPSKHKDALSATIHLQPGTHHIKFIVDGEMRTSDALPTAVDFTNILVNYIEVSPDDRPGTTTGETALGPPVIPPGHSVPIDIKPPAGAADGSGSAVGAPPKQPRYRVPPNIRPPQVLPPTPELIAEHERPSSQQQQSTPSQPVTQPKTPAQPKGTRIPTKYYHNVVPKFLLDLDAPDGSTAQRNAMAVSETLPAPPTLPGFLGKSVLNGAMPMKDDASVLIMPNHTVLNHLATSSIRQGVLATSATTRYKQKFLTTIIYKPTSDVGD